jgi:hypothetical protein
MIICLRVELNGQWPVTVSMNANSNDTQLQRQSTECHRGNWSIKVIYISILVTHFEM